MDRWSLLVSYPFGGEFHKDADIEYAVGRKANGSGADVGGQIPMRDLQFDFDDSATLAKAKWRIAHLRDTSLKVEVLHNGKKIEFE